MNGKFSEISVLSPVVLSSLSKDSERVFQHPANRKSMRKYNSRDKPAKILLRLRVNGETQEVATEINKTLLEVLREDMNLTGTKHGCELGECGTCAVLVNGQPVLSCLMLGIEAVDSEIATVEGMTQNGKAHPLQNAFADLGAAQCGYCIPGILLTAKALLDDNSASDAAGNPPSLVGKSLPLHWLHEDLASGGARGAGNEQMKKKTLSVIGKPLRKIDAMAKCAGETIFADDLNLPRMIYAKLLRSPHPHARILGINIARAVKLDGVFAVLTGADLPQKFGIMPSTEDEEALAIDKVRYAGDPVAAVAAASESIAEKALGLIDVEYEVLKPILTIEEALACTEESERIHTWNRHANIQKAVSFEFGDVDGGFAGSDFVLEGTFFYQGNTHLPMEQYAAVAFYGPDDKLTLWSSTQTPHYVHRTLG